MGETGKNPLQEFSGFREGEETGCDFLKIEIRSYEADLETSLNKNESVFGEVML
jgi:hypothetical protein